MMGKKGNGVEFRQAGSDRIEVHAAGGIMGMHGTCDLHINGE